MEIGDRVQTLNTFVPITGEIVDMYKNLVTIADDDAETVGGSGSDEGFLTVLPKTLVFVIYSL